MENKNVLVCVTGQRSCERLIVSGAALAKKAGGELAVLHVARKGSHVLGSDNEAEALEYLLNVSVRHDADMLVVRSDDVQGVIEKQVKLKEIGTLVAGRSPKYNGWDLLDELKLRVPEVTFEIL